MSPRFPFAELPENAPSLEIATLPTAIQSPIRTNFWIKNPVNGRQTYQVIALGINGEVLSHASVEVYSAVEYISISHQAETQQIFVEANEPSLKLFSVSLMTASGVTVLRSESAHPTCQLDLSTMDSGIYFIVARTYDVNGNLLGNKISKVVIRH